MKKETFYSIAIDGPAGSGKSTVAKAVAKDFNFDYVSSGSFYRCVALFLDEKNINYMNENLINDNVLSKIDIGWNSGDIFLNGRQVNMDIQTSKCSSIASVIATYPKVRDFINKQILDLSKLASIVVDGRDIGTIVLPNATAKVFLDADITSRALRILKRSSEVGVKRLDINQIISEIIDRDNRDYTRPIAPLAKAADAHEIDCSELTLEETINKVKRYYMGKVINESFEK